MRSIISPANVGLRTSSLQAVFGTTGRDVEKRGVGRRGEKRTPGRLPEGQRQQNLRSSQGGQRKTKRVP